ncbi:hypothetical protein GCM10010387_33040 [Streptomyces inusitatus]|uniref:Uncharacterized protein n=1 Tax=Streptomyces inusitatus TaxID=68221 RepID=A0A918UV56_9ACTN|nr:hypothetical protein [Streptomyces inusitatus]GGZ36371.1 hypothetical protein GCM10010387_33040 [Streptomyces inusitatus]
MAFMRYKTTGFAWAMAYPGEEWKVLFRRGEEAALVNGQSLVSSGPLTTVVTHFQGVPEAYRKLSEAVVMTPLDRGSWATLFVRGSSILFYNWDRGRISEGRWDAFYNWGTALPEFFRSQVDALLQAPNAADGNWQTYFFKGPRVLTLHWTSGVVRNALITEGPDASGCAGWARLPEGFRSDLDQVIAYKPATDGARQSLLVKGDQGLLLNWRTGPVGSAGKLHELGIPGLSALPEPYRTPYRTVTGTWKKDTGTGQRAELRVDLEGSRALCMVSGDLFNPDGSLAGSFRSTDALTIEQHSDRYTLTQTGLAWAGSVAQTTLTLTVPRVPATATPAAAALSLTKPDGTGPLQFACAQTGTALRMVELETDVIEGVEVFQSYDTTLAPVPPGYRNRVLSVASAYAEAGIEIRAAGTANTIADSSGTDLRWSPSELYAAMRANYSLRGTSPQWKLWAFIASYSSTEAFGLMFDTQFRGRQGLVILYKSLRDHQALGTADELLTYVHEIGHAFNLSHSWRKDINDPPSPLGPNQGYGELSWMNYPWGYDDGAGRQGAGHFWQDFPFHFSTDELRHLRHGHYRHVVPGGSSFQTGGALLPDEALATAQTPLRDDGSGLALTLGGKQVFGYGEPVTAELKLALTGTRDEVTAARHIGPGGERTLVLVTDPRGRTTPFRPMVRACHGHGAAEQTLTLTTAQPAVYETVYLGYGADGLTFADPGLYRVTAVHTALDGTRLVSPTRTLRVRLPLDRTDQEAGELLLGDEQGALLTLLGSDTPTLTAGNDALQELIERHGDHPLAAHARLAHGANAGRHFQTITDGRLTVRQPDTATATHELTDAITASRTDEATGLDNLTLNAAMRRLATVHAKAGDLDRAEAVLTDLTTHFHHQGVPAHVQQHIRQQADETRAAIAELTGDQT